MKIITLFPIFIATRLNLTELVRLGQRYVAGHTSLPLTILFKPENAKYGMGGNPKK
jgi:hypothetical protein